MSPSSRPDLPVVLLMTSNGAGMGHLARQAAVAAAAVDAAQAGATSFEPVLVSMSSALPVVAAASGVRAEYVPGPATRWMRVDRWHRYLERRLVALVRETGARALVFDGTSPYPGLLAAARTLPGLRLVWSRRGLWRPDASRAPLRTSRFFDLVVEPGDLAQGADRGPTAGLAGVTHLDPVTLLETESSASSPQRLTRAQARTDLGLDPDRPTLLVSLGAGNVNDPTAAAGAVVRAALDAPGWQVAVTRAPLSWRGLPDELRSRVTVLDRVYPLVRYVDAFDAAVSAAGYNAVHELVLGGVPTLLVPNLATSADDQVTRATSLADRGLALRAPEADPGALADGVRQLLDPAARERLADATSRLPAPKGAAQLAEAVTALLAAPANAAAGPAVVRDPYRPVRQASVLLRRTVGEQRWEAARRMAGAPPRTLADAPRPVLEADGPIPTGVRRLVVTSDLADVTGNPDVVVEHVLAGSSEAYLRERRAIIATSYPRARLVADPTEAEQQ